MIVLIVDDVGYSRHYHSRMLQKLGHSTVVAESGAEALRRLERDQSIEVVLTDLMMQGMDGLELFAAAQSITRASDTGAAAPPAFILMTSARPGSNAQPRDLQKIQLAKQMGFVDIAFKPVDPSHLKETLETLEAARGKLHRAVDVSQLTHQLLATTVRIVECSDLESAQTLRETIQTVLQKLESIASPVDGELSGAQQSLDATVL